MTVTVSESEKLDESVEVLKERERKLRQAILDSETPTFEQVEEHRNLVWLLRQARRKS